MQTEGGLIVDRRRIRSTMHRDLTKKPQPSEPIGWEAQGPGRGDFATPPGAPPRARLSSTLPDLLICAGAAWVLAGVLPSLSFLFVVDPIDWGEGMELVWFTSSIGFVLLYFSTPNGFWSRSVGQWASCVRTVRVSGDAVGVGRALLRSVTLVLPPLMAVLGSPLAVVGNAITAFDGPPDPADEMIIQAAALAAAIGLILSLFSVVLALALDGRCLHDWITDTRVVSTRRGRKERASELP